MKFSQCSNGLKMIKTTFKKTDILTKWSYQQKIGSFPLQGITAGQLLENVATKYPNRLAVISAYQSKTLTFGELLENADIFAAGLMNIGMIKGDHVAIWSPNSLEWVMVSLACARAGFVLAQLNHSYKANELLYSVNKVQIKLLICGHDTTKQHYYDILKQNDANMFDSKGKLPVVCTTKMASLKFVVTLSEHSDTLSFPDVIQHSTHDRVNYIKKNQHLIDIDDPLNIQFTSGSTGNPKAALLSHHNVVNNAYAIGNRFKLHEKHHSICVNVPFFHTFGTTAAIFTALNFGATLVLPYDFYDPKKSLETISTYNCSVIYGTPTMYVDLIAQQRIFQLHLCPDIICTGGAPTTPQLIKDIYQLLQPKAIVNICGMTESTAVFYQSYLDSAKDIVINNLGFLGDHIEAKVINNQNHLVPIGTAGELCVRGYNTMLGYYDDAMLTEKSFMSKGWLRTGDKFVMHEDGSGQLIGRIKDIIIRGGENIHPKEIEDYISTHPFVLECQVVGLPHSRLGEEVCACIRMKEQKNVVTLDEIKSYCDGKIAHYKIPSKLHIFDEYPKTTSGKIQKYKIIIELLKLKSMKL